MKFFDLAVSHCNIEINMMFYYYVHRVDTINIYAFIRYMYTMQQHNVLSLYALGTRLISISTQVALRNN